jgi:hypothetical protein
MYAAGIPSHGKAWLNVSISRDRYTTDALDLDVAVCSAHTHAVHRNRRPSVFAVDQQSIHLDFPCPKNRAGIRWGMLCPARLMVRLFYGVPQTSVQQGAVFRP